MQKENWRELSSVLQAIMKVGIQKVPRSPATIPSSGPILQKPMFTNSQNDFPALYP